MLHFLSSPFKRYPIKVSTTRKADAWCISMLVAPAAISDHREEKYISRHPYARKIKNRTSFLEHLSIPPEKIQPGDIVCYFPRKCPKGIPLIVYAQVKSVT